MVIMNFSLGISNANFPNNLVNIGRVSKAIGYSGQIKIVFQKNLDSIPNLKGTIWLSIDKKMVPFSLKEVHSINKESAIISLDDIINPDQCKLVTGRDLFYPLKVNKRTKLADDNFSFLVGYKLIDQNDTTLGKISEVALSYGQILLTIENQQKNFLVPFHENILIGIDQDKQTISLEIAEGLMDL